MYRITTFVLTLFFLLTGCRGDQSVEKTLLISSDSLSSIHHEAQDLFNQARDLQKKEEFVSAIPFYEKLIALEPVGEDIKPVAGLMDEGCLQLVYCYIFAGQRKDGADYFSRLYNERELWFIRNYPRSVEVCLAYSLYEATRLDEAVVMIDRALARPTEGREKDQLYVDNGIASVIYNQVGDIRKAIACGERSLEIIRTLEDKTKIVFVLGNLIYQYQQVGEFEKALSAYDDMILSGQGEKNPYGLCAAEVNVVQLYDEWGLEEEVELHLSKAREAAVLSDVPDAFLRVDNLAVYYALQSKQYEKAVVLLDSMSRRLPDPTQNSFYHEFYDNYKSILAVHNMEGKEADVIAGVRQLVISLKSKPLNNLSVLTIRLLGDALVEVGEKQLAIDVYRVCCDYIQENHLLNQQRMVYYRLGVLYEGMGRFAEASRFLLMAREADRSFTERRNAGLISQFRVKYETREKEHVNKLLRSEIQLKERTLQYYASIGILLFLLGIIFLLWLVMRHRTLKLKHEANLREHELTEIRHKESLRLIEEQEKQLRQMLTERQNMNRKNEELREQIERSDARNTMQEVINSLSPHLLTNEEEQEFRRQFCILHPSFMLRLREVCPTVTRNEELLAMLIRLNLTSEEIALALGNNRASVNTSRFRLRKKLGVEKEVSLDDFFRNL
ncbi:outer membrane protein assembly factor BamD [Parabacteroides timonensis]|uniref:hypothetical protein n=1 Tax=Parabacteroides timonensis TaxID=1871013 RepID=UPI00094E34AC|nr:hypothetical protein [Parabacteroides timonensis]